MHETDSLNLSNASIYLDIVDIYDITTGQFTSTSTGAGRLSEARANLVAAAAGNKIIFAGG